MYVLLDEAWTLETKYKLLDPVAITNDPLYTTYGPYSICAQLQEEHEKLVSNSDWPTLASKLPESNTIPVALLENQSSTVSPGHIIQCYKCKQYGHKANNPIYLVPSANAAPLAKWGFTNSRTHMIPTLPTGSWKGIHSSPGSGSRTVSTS